MLADKAFLVNLKVSQWTGRKLDKNATRTVTVQHETQNGVGNYTKKLLPGSSELKKVSYTVGVLRNYFYQQTLPWFADGSRILSSKNYMDFVKGIREHKEAFDKSVADFINEYPRLHNEASIKLGSLFNPNEYPSVSYLQRAFSCDILFMPMPDINDFRVELLDSEKDAFLAKMREAEAEAVNDCWQRLYGVVNNAILRLKNSDGKGLRESLIENVYEMCALLPKLNVTDNMELENMRQNLEGALAGVSIEDCRNNAMVRNDTSKKLEDIIANMSPFMS